MAETFTKWISLDGRLDVATSWSNGVPDGTKIAFFERGSGVKPSVNPDFSGAVWKGLIVEPGFPHDIAQVGAPLHIKVQTIVQHRGSGTLHLKLTKFVIASAQMIIDGDAIIDGVEAGSDHHVASVLVIGGRVQFLGNFKVFRNVQFRRFRLGAPHVTVSSSGTNGSMNDIEINAGRIIFEEPYEFQAGSRLSVNGGLIDILHAAPSNFWTLVLNAGQVRFHPVKDALIGEVHLHGGVFDTRSGTALKDIQRLIRTGGRIIIDDRTDITETIDLTRQ